MATRSRIGIQLADDSVLSVYCHWDGYPEFNGVKLVEHFNSYVAASELIDGGDMSCLWTNAGWQNETLPTTGPLYYSSRGEDRVPQHHKDLNEYLMFADHDCCGEYAYLYQNDQWVCYQLQSQFPDTVKEVQIPTPVVA